MSANCPVGTVCFKAPSVHGLGVGIVPFDEDVLAATHSDMTLWF
jgi:hypothetical protein